jgi:very-short-patch-repair endonuclease
VTRSQLLAHGVGRGAIESRRRAGRLTLLHRGVYRVGPVELALARHMAAALACGDGAVVSHDDAGRIAKPRSGVRPDPRIDPEHEPFRRPGIHVRRVHLPREELTTVKQIPVTNVARTILDLAVTRPAVDVEELLAEVFARKLTSRADLDRLLDRHRGRPGVPVLREILAPGPPGRIRSEAERRLLALVRAAGLPRPRVNARIDGYEVDFLWPDHRLVVEVDGHAFHSNRPQRERDSRRDRDLAVHGYLVLRVTWRQIDREPEALVARIAALLERLSARRAG